jgi:hypothetical protein
MTEVAPSCPISFSQYPTVRIHTGRGIDPRSPVARLHDQINRIPRAYDLPSAINALNLMSNIILQLTRGEPQVNNIYPFPLDGGGLILQGGEYGRRYGPGDWVLEERTYQDQDLINPDDEDQVIPMKVLKTVLFKFFDANANLEYFTFPAGGS